MKNVYYTFNGYRVPEEYVYDILEKSKNILKDDQGYALEENPYLLTKKEFNKINYYEHLEGKLSHCNPPRQLYPNTQYLLNRLKNKLDPKNVPIIILPFFQRLFFSIISMLFSMLFVCFYWYFFIIYLKYIFILMLIIVIICNFTLRYKSNNIQNILEKYAELFKAAEQGDPNAQNSLGIIYKEGKETKKNYIEAFKWYQKAAGQGIADAQYNLGIMYYSGKGVPQNYFEAYFWFLLSTTQNNDENVLTKRKKVEKMLSQETMFKIQKRASEWKPITKNN